MSITNNKITFVNIIKEIFTSNIYVQKQIYILFIKGVQPFLYDM